MIERQIEELKIKVAELNDRINDIEDTLGEYKNMLSREVSAMKEYARYCASEAKNGRYVI